MSEQALSPRAELEELHLQMQRRLVLAAFRWVATPSEREWLLTHPDRLPEEILESVKEVYAQKLNHALVRTAFWAHNVLDRFRFLKTQAFRLQLLWRRVRSVAFPGWRWASYSTWREQEAARRSRALHGQTVGRDAGRKRYLLLSEAPPPSLSDPRVVWQASSGTPVWKKEWSDYDAVLWLRGTDLWPDTLSWVEFYLPQQQKFVWYADSEGRDWRGRVTEPHFHPDMSWEYFFSRHPGYPLTVWNPKYMSADISAEASLTDLLVSAAVVNRVGHIPRVLSIRGRHGAVQDEAFFSASREALAKYGRQLVRTPWGARVEPKTPDRWPKVSVIIPTKDGLHLLRPLMEGLLNRTDYPNFDVLIVNNNSTKPATFAYFREVTSAHPHVRVVDFPQPYNFSAINNFAMKQVDGDVLALVNNDIEVLHPDWLLKMVSWAVLPDVGAVGAKLFFADGSIQHAGVVLGIGQVAGHVHGFDAPSASGYLNRLQFSHEFSALTCACFVLRREVFVRADYFSEDLAVAYNDVDFCLKIRSAGFRNIWAFDARLIHKESSTRPPDRRPEQVRRYRHEVEIMRTRWGSYIEHDPAYSPSLTRHAGDFSLNWSAN